MPYHGSKHKIDIITKMWRNLPFKTSNQTGPSSKPCVYRIERVPTADRYRIIYGIEVPRAIEVSGMELAADFSKAIHQLSQHIFSEARYYQGGSIHVQPVEPQDDIEIEVSL